MIDNHTALVKLATEWLRKQCSVVISEMATSGEEPDAIGWRGVDTILVECKHSRADFVCDAQKPHRQIPASGLGQHRYFLAMPGVIRVQELPAGWGLLEVTGRRLRIVKKAEYQPANHRQEVRLLLSALRRIGANPTPGMSIRCYTIATRNRAELHILPECNSPKPTSNPRNC